ncbi:MAG: CoA ester lyase [Alphaproteobacteria bacterium]|nr:CoA ester lyase [Alphaproteobacteria bacterium]
MPISFRPRRSALYIPGANTRALAKGRTLPADMLILDLEDAVAPEAKETARAALRDVLAEGGYGGREILIRINGLETEWGAADLTAMADAGADAILLPKVESAETVRAAEAALDAAGAPAGLALWCMIETPLGVLRVQGIAAAAPRLAGLVMGTSDLAKDLNCRHTPDRAPLLTSLSLALLAARAHGLAILDGVHLDLADDTGFEAACRQGRALGFDGKTLIHPKTIAAANAAFGPSDADLETARRTVAAYEQAAAQGQGVALLDGKLVEALHAEEARRLLDLAAMIAALERPE